jgi:hypothetical protein
MSNRSAKFVSAIFASILVGTNFAAVAENSSKEDSAKTADKCLSGPKGALPAGGHWYYRIDHAAKRNCWYIGEEKNKSARAAPTDSSSSPAASAPASPDAANPDLPPQNTDVRKSIADARAEFAPQMRAEQDAGVNTGLQTSAVAPVSSIQNSQSATAPDAPTPSSPITSRWPESSGVSPSSGPRLASAEPPQTVQTQSLQTDATPAPQPAVTPVALAAADSSQRSASMQMLLLSMAGALALAGITASLIFRFGRTRLVQPENRGDRRAIWDSVRTERRAPAMFPAANTPIWQRDLPRNPPRNLPRDPRAPDDPERRVTEMLARLARSAQT